MIGHCKDIIVYMCLVNPLTNNAPIALYFFFTLSNATQFYMSVAESWTLLTG